MATDLTPSNVYNEEDVGRQRARDEDDEDIVFGGKRRKRKHNDPLRSLNYEMGVQGKKEKYSRHASHQPRPSNAPPDSSALAGSTAGRRAWKVCISVCVCVINEYEC